MACPVYLELFTWPKYLHLYHVAAAKSALVSPSAPALALVPHVAKAPQTDSVPPPSAPCRGTKTSTAIIDHEGGRTGVTSVAGPPDKEPLPSIQVDTDAFVDSAKTADPAEIAEQLRHANEQLELTRHYPGREPRSHAARSLRPNKRLIRISHTSRTPSSVA